MTTLQHTHMYLFVKALNVVYGLLLLILQFNLLIIVVELIATGWKRYNRQSDVCASHRGWKSVCNESS